MDIKLALQKAESLGFTNVQTSSPPDDLLEGQKRKDLVAGIRGSKVKITTMFCGFAGESYADIPTVKKTVGYLTPETREARLARTFKISDVAKEAGVKRIAAHIGFVPEDKNDPNHTAMVQAVQRIADHCKKNGQEFSLETGQEKADVLLEFIHEVNRPNVKVNFDPANMILYGTGEPIPALKVLGKYVVGVHCKDGTWPT
ncbi:MAG: sugar phosphate isomerase/epimerase, partial [Planctomycetes bacterium]|nr:sugar phosphate isomerase/epimerase [Planctomycetota bacterium]